MGKSDHNDVLDDPFQKADAGGRARDALSFQVVICVGRSTSRRIRFSQHLTVDLIRAGLRQRVQIHDLARILVRQKS